MIHSRLRHTDRLLHSPSPLIRPIITDCSCQDVLQVLKAPKIIFQKGQLVPINKPCVYLPPMLPTASSKICLLNTPPKSMLNPGGDGEEEVSNRMKKMSRPLDGKDEEENNTKYALT